MFQDEELKLMFNKVKECCLSDCKSEEYGMQMVHFTKAIGDKMGAKFNEMAETESESDHEMMKEIIQCMYTLHVHLSLTTM